MIHKVDIASADGVLAGGVHADDRGLSSRVQLSPDLDMMAARQLRQALLAAIDGHGSVVLLGGDVERFSTPCAQVMVAAARAAEVSGVTIHLENASANLLAAIDDLGVRSALASWIS